jgi:hypothetical protein
MVGLCVALTTAVGYAKDVGKNTLVEMDKAQRINMDLETGMQPARASAQAGTTFLGTWTFDVGPNCTNDGWTMVDRTVQIGAFWHVDDFAGLGGGTYGLLVPLEGAQSMWCGARADAGSMTLCGYSVLPGYGNSWSQMICSDCLPVTGNVAFDYLVAIDSEPGYDQSIIEYSLCDDTWITLSSTVNAGNGNAYDGTQAGILDNVAVDTTLHSGSVQFRFRFDSDTGWSDEDGLWDTDGAIIVDSLVVSDATGLVDYEDFESATVGDFGAGVWNNCNDLGYGNYAALYPGLSLYTEDPCRSDLDCMWTFFTGSTYDYACYGQPGVTVVPYGNSRNQYLLNEVWSPWIPFVGTGTKVEYAFWVNRLFLDDSLLRYIWGVRSMVAGCPQSWQDDGFVYGGGDNMDWLPDLNDIGNHIAPGATHIQLMMGVFDVCPYVCGIWGTGNCHGPGPYFDDVQVYRIAGQGPQWRVRTLDLWQDNFSSDGTVTGTVRLDMARDILPSTSAGITPGDSIVAEVSDPEVGLAADPYTGFGPAVYAFVRVDPPQAGKGGSFLETDAFRWPLVDSTITSDGNLWYMVRFDTAFTQPGRVGSAPDRYCLDLNDNLLTPGDQLHYFLGGQSVGGAWTYYFSAYNHLDNNNTVGSVKTTADIDEAAVHAEEMTCLPDVGGQPGADILWVNDAAERSLRPFMTTAFEQLNLEDKVDRYDIMAPTSHIGNGLQSRVVDIYQQLIPIYKKIIWTSGNLSEAAIGDGQLANEKTDDYAVLFTFLDQSNLDPGVAFGSTATWSPPSGPVSVRRHPRS